MSAMFTTIDVVEKHSKNQPVMATLPILFDATCNGTQHLAALLKDMQLGKQVNLVYNDNKQGDYYAYCADKISKAFDS